MKPTSSKHLKPQAKRRPPKGDVEEMNQATAEEFEREGMGIAPKE